MMFEREEARVLDFEKKFQKSMAIMITLHVLSTCIVIYLIEVHIPWRRGSLAESFELRSSLDFLMRCATPVGSVPERICTEQWPTKVDIVSRTASEVGIIGTKFQQIKSLNFPEFLLNSESRDETYRILLEIAAGYDREWVRKNSGYHTAVASAGWIAGLLSVGFLIYLSSFYKSISEYLLVPMVELVRALDEWTGGNRLRRCQKKGEGKDFRVLMDSINDLLDEGLLPKSPQKKSSQMSKINLEKNS